MKHRESLDSIYHNENLRSHCRGNYVGQLNVQFRLNGHTQLFERSGLLPKGSFKSELEIGVVSFRHLFPARLSKAVSTFTFKLQNVWGAFTQHCHPTIRLETKIL